MRYRSAIPAPPPRFRMMPGWQQRKCIGDTIATTTATTTVIIVGTAGTTIIITVTTTAATGTAGEGDLIEINRPAHRGPIIILA